MSKELVVVLGMHRSGTSVLTKGIAELGYLVDETMEATEDNAKGYFENKDLVGLNDEILDELKLEWSTCDLIILNRCQTFLPIIIEKYEKRAIELLENLFLKSEKCVVKDPRISILMPFWEYIFNKINIKYNYVLALRNPLEVSNSFVSRKNGSIDEGLKVWTYYNALILKNLFKQTLVVNYKDLLNETSRVMNDLCEFLSIDRERYNLNIEKFINEFVEKGLNHHNKEVESGENVVNDLYSFLNKKYLDNFDNKKYIEVNEEFIDKYLGFDYGNCSGQYSQIYVDDGSGFSENNSFKSKLNGDHKQNLNISFDKFEDVKNLRIDPTDRECVFILESFVNE